LETNQDKQVDHRSLHSLYVQYLRLPCFRLFTVFKRESSFLLSHINSSHVSCRVILAVESVYELTAQSMNSQLSLLML